MKELLNEYKDFLLYCYDRNVITPEEFYVKLKWIKKVEQYVK